MSVTPAGTYLTDNYYSRFNSSSIYRNASEADPENQKKETVSSSGDRITFSAGLSAARTREAMGLNPTGKLKLSDLEAAAEEREEFVSLTLTQTMLLLGINPDQEVSLSLGADNKIYVSGDFSEKAELEEALNENENFTTAFKQLNANRSILDYVSELQYSARNTEANLIDHYNSDMDLDDLLSIAAEYKSIKSGSNIMETLLGLSSSQSPHTYTYNEKTE